jgi:hypothetical protein
MRSLLVLLKERSELGIVESVQDEDQQLKRFGDEQLFLKVDLFVDRAEHEEEEMETSFGYQGLLQFKSLLSLLDHLLLLLLSHILISRNRLRRHKVFKACKHVHRLVKRPILLPTHYLLPFLEVCYLTLRFG